MIWPRFSPGMLGGRKALIFVAMVFDERSVMGSVMSRQDLVCSSGGHTVVGASRLDASQSVPQRRYSFMRRLCTCLAGNHRLEILVAWCDWRRVTSLIGICALDKGFN